MQPTSHFAIQSNAMSPESHQPLARTGPRAMARMRFDIDWESPLAHHRDSFIATRINLWRDQFPLALESHILDKPVGHSTAYRFGSGELTTPWRESLLFRVPLERFDRRYTGRGFVQPREGRFYPKGILRDVEGVFRADPHPFRVVEIAGPDLIVDFNHSLADKDLDLTVAIEEIWTQQGEERGGRCNEIADLITADGPGMQGRWREVPTDFWSDLPFIRRDPRPDTEFYRTPRLVQHLDSTALAEMARLYSELILSNARVLDLMASWDSHIPETLALGGVSGLGMNAEELAANHRLLERTVQDLNLDPQLPYPNDSFDTVICSLSVEYLTRPVEVFSEVARVLRKGGRFIVTFSNRWFPPKVVQIWEGIHEFERPGFVLECLLRTNRFRDLHTRSMRGLPRPADDKYADRLATSDPIYAVWGTAA